MNKTQGGKKDTNSHNHINTDTEGKDTRGYLINQGTKQGPSEKNLRLAKRYYTQIIIQIDKNTGKLKIQDHVAVQLKALPPILEMQKKPKPKTLNKRYQAMIRITSKQN